MSEKVESTPSVDFSFIRGHRRPLSILSRAIERQRLSHAYLFVGLDGIGKCLVARAMAWALLCEDTFRRPCLRCSKCLKVRSGNHPDLIIMEPDKRQIRITQIREMQAKLIHGPSEGPLRVVIINEAHSMNPHAANAMLKVLEEPPPANIFILVCISLDSMLPTIVSRCQVIHFSPLGSGEIISHLKEEAGLSDHDAMAVALRSQGSMARALEMAKGGGRTRSPQAKEVFEAFMVCEALESLQLMQNWSRDRDTAIGVLKTLLGVLRDMTVLALGGNGLENPFLREGTLQRGWRMGMERLVESWSWVLEAIRGLEQNNWNPQLTLEQTFFRLRGAAAPDAQNP
jgi:DNA polymerase-3 subunit delta'